MKKMSRRVAEIKECEADISRMKGYRHDVWCRDYIERSEGTNWSYIIICGGDRVSELDEEFMREHGKRVMVREIEGMPHTVLKIRNGLVDALLRAKNLKTFHRCLTRVLPDRVLRRYHYDLWLAAHNLAARCARMMELQNRRSGSPRATETAMTVFGNTSIRAAAKFYGKL